MKNFMCKVKEEFNDRYALLAISIIFISLYVLTYGKWGMILVDCFHDHYVASTLLTGKQLYTEIAYLYPPMIPYLFKLLFTIFTPNLNILYIFGGITAYLSTIILFITARQTLNIKYSLLLVLLFLATCAFDPGNKNYIFGYVAPAILANLLALATLLFVILHYKKDKSYYIYLCSLLTTLSFLTKIEFAFAQLFLLIIYSAILFYLKDNRLKDCIYSVLLSLSATTATYLTFVQSFGSNQVRELIIPSSYLEAGGFFHTKTILGGITLDAILYGSIALGILVLLATIIIGGLYYYTKKSETKPKLMLTHLSICILIVATLVCFTDLKNFISDNHLKFFSGINFIILALLIYFIKNLKKDSKYVILTIISFFCLLISLRSPLFLNLEFFASYYLPATFIIVFYFLFVFLPETLLKKADSKAYINASTLFIVCLITFFSIKDAGLYARKNTLISKKGIGSIFVDDKYGKEVKKVLEKITSNTNNNDTIFVIPEEVFYYTFSNKQAPGKFYYINPGAFGDNKTNAVRLIEDLEAHKPKYIIVSNLPRYEFGSVKYIDYYYKKFIDWIKIRYDIVNSYQTYYQVAKGVFYKIDLYKIKD